MNAAAAVEVPLWDFFEARFHGPALSNPFIEAEITVHFEREASKLDNNASLSKDSPLRISGFYDGEQTWCVRFMPTACGKWTYRTHSSHAELDGLHGTFHCTAPRTGKHGPVHVRKQFHFEHADGTPFFPFGTTCYAWTHQPLAMQTQTLHTLAKTRFNKLRMCVFPKHYIYNENEPLHRMFELRHSAEDRETAEDFDRPNLAAFRHLDAQVLALRELGIEADLILFHPYDRWGYCEMNAAQDLRYLRYVVSRLAAYSNVWWSLANEYDFLLDAKPLAHWEQMLRVLAEGDPYRHLISIHNGAPEANFDHNHPLISHVCIQNWDVKRTGEWRAAWGKPLVNDEPEYEGNIPLPWGNLSARELVHRAWITLMRGGYIGHGETYLHPQDALWWAKGGDLHGESWRRLSWLRSLLEEDVRHGLTPFLPPPEGSDSWEFTRICVAEDAEAGVRYLYFGEHQPAQCIAPLPSGSGDCEIHLIDTWEMTLTPVKKERLSRSPALRGPGGVSHELFPKNALALSLPGKPYLALRIRWLAAPP